MCLLRRSRSCRCGHPREAHEHYAAPGDLRCGLCECGKFRRRLLGLT